MSTSPSGLVFFGLTIRQGDCLESFACEEECWLNVETSSLNDRVNVLYNQMSKESDHQQSTRMLLDNSLKQMHLAALARDEFVDQEIKELHG